MSRKTGSSRIKPCDGAEILGDVPLVYPDKGYEADRIECILKGLCLLMAAAAVFRNMPEHQRKALPDKPALKAPAHYPKPFIP